MILAVALFQFACQEDPLDDINDGDWNNERSVIDIKFENQVGIAEIERVDDQTGTISLQINAAVVSDFSQIAIQELELSYGAKATAEIGGVLNFDNEMNSASLTVSSPTGKSREYTVTVTPFTETLIGTYNITNLVMYGGTGPEWGGGGVMALTDKPWIWPDNGPQKELDNVLSFEMTGITDDGNTYGIVTNNAGDDSEYADFVFIGDPKTDVNHFYRKIPKGEGEWLRNYSTGLITFTFTDGSTVDGTFVGAGTEDLGNGLSKTVTDNAFVFTLAGTDDWDSIYSDYDKFVKNPHKYWVDVTKQ